MNVYYLEKFNNYYNRQLKKYNTKKISDFEEFIIYSETDKNFNPNDNVRTNLTANFYQTNLPHDPDIDYILVSEDGINTTSKWYVVEKTRNRKGQWMLDLRRDLLSDYFNEISNSPFFCEKGYLDINDKFIFNSENMSYNQIKKDEKLLKDVTGCPWIVGYCSANSFDTAIELVVSETTASYAPTPPLDYATLSNLQNKNLAGINTVHAKLIGNVKYFMGNVVGAYNVGSWNMEIAPNGTVISNRKVSYNTTAISWNYFDDENWQTEMSAVTNEVANKIKIDGNFQSALLNQGKVCIEEDTNLTYIDYSKYRTLLGMVGTWYNDGTRLFRIVKNYSANSVGRSYMNVRSGAYYEAVKGIVTSIRESTCNASSISSNSNSGIGIYLYTDEFNFTIEVNEQNVIKNNITSTVNTLNDAPYKMFAIPYSLPECDIVLNNQSIKSTIRGNFGTRVATQLAAALGGSTGFLYDIQLLPYCPAIEMIDDGKIEIGGTEGTDYILLKNESESGRIESFIFWPTQSSFNIRSDVGIQINNSDPIEFKIEHETKFCRLVAPNYTNAFEFKPTSNYGISGFEINCTYKPFQPYIHINPVFNNNGLYGGDYNDNRGLICTGDYSLPIVTDAWTKFQIENKSYSEAFNRQIQNMETNNAVQREREVISATLGGISGTVYGAGAGAMVGGPIGAGIGSLTSGIANYYGAIKDIEMADRLRAEGIDFTKDMFGYNLQNIQALPVSISKISSFDINSKLFPFIEYYEATESEETALRNKLKYNGMTIMAIGKLTDYTDLNNRYIKGQLIRLQDETENPVGEFHEAVEIASELSKGVFI